MSCSRGGQLGRVDDGGEDGEAVLEGQDGGCVFVATTMDLVWFQVVCATRSEEQGQAPAGEKASSKP